MVDPVSAMIGAGSGLIAADIWDKIQGKRRLEFSKRDRIKVQLNTSAGIICGQSIHYQKIWGSFSKPRDQLEESCINTALMGALMCLTESSKAFAVSFHQSLALVAMALTNKPKDKMLPIPL
jgi:hypothetical protein